MTGYERVLRAVRRELADRLPVDYSAMPEAHGMLMHHLGLDSDEALLRRLGCDFRRVEARFTGPSDMTGKPGITAEGKDFWGIIRAPVRNQFGTYCEIVHHPLAAATSAKDIENHTWPSLDWFDYSHLSEQIDRINDRERYCILFFAGGTFETSWYMRGMSRFLMDLLEAPKIAEAMCRRVTDFFTKRAMKAIEQSRGKIDMIFSNGDIGTQRGMMLSPSLWREHIKPYTVEYITPFRKMGLMTMYHSCGSIVPVIDDFIEMGLDILDPIQPGAVGMDPDSLRTSFGRRITFHGGVDEQHLLPHGSPEEVRKEVARTMSILGADGGYIVCPAHNIQADTPPENILALYDTVLGR